MTLKISFKNFSDILGQPFQTYSVNLRGVAGPYPFSEKC